MFSPAETNKEDRINVVSRGDDGVSLRDTPLSLRDIPRVVEKSVNSVSAFGAKSSVHSLSPPLPIEPANAGLRRGPQLGELLAYTRKSLPCKGRCRLRRQRGSPERTDSIKTGNAHALPVFTFTNAYSALSFPYSFSISGKNTPPTTLPREMTTRYRRLFPGAASSSPDTAQ